MPITFLLDTDVIIDIQRKFPPAGKWYSGVDITTIGVSGFTVLELTQKARNRIEARAAKQITGALPILWPDAFQLSQMQLQFESLYLSNGVGILDALIALTAIAHRCTLFTFNSKHYRNIPNLQILQPCKK